MSSSNYVLGSCIIYTFYETRLENRKTILMIRLTLIYQVDVNNKNGAQCVNFDEIIAI